MTDFHVECVRVGAIEKHPNADTLGITHVGAYPVIVKLGDFQPGDLAVYVPVDAVVPENDERWEFLQGHRRIKAKRLRGVFSQGLLTPAPLGVSEGDDCACLMGIERYETPEERAERGPNQAKSTAYASTYFPRYTDLENLRRWPDVLQPGERVVVMEKLEGENVRVTYIRAPWWQRLIHWFGYGGAQGDLLVGSRNQIKTSGKWTEATAFLKRRFERQSDPERYTLYGESFGYTKGFPYNSGGLPQFRLFDVWDRKEFRWLCWKELRAIADAFGVDLAPLLYWGDWDPALVSLAEGNSVIDPSHMREGFVVRPVYERNEPGLGRVIFKCKGEGYLLRKDG